MLKKNNGLLHGALVWSAGVIVALFLFWLCWQGFLVSYLGLRGLSLTELLAFCGLVAFVFGAVGGLVELLRERK